MSTEKFEINTEAIWRGFLNFYADNFKGGIRIKYTLVKWKYIPYVVILIFCVITAIIRVIMIGDYWSWVYHLVAFLAQIAFTILVWEFVKWISNYLDKRMPKDSSITKRIVLQILISMIVIVPPYLLFVSVIDKIVPIFINKGFIAAVSLVFFIVVILMNIAYRASWFFRQWRKSVEEKAALQVKTAMLEKDKSMMRYHHLKNQVNPHFLFNTFTSLDGLIQTNPQLASEFVRHLSKVYRYVLEHKENDVVSVETELAFIEHYISMLKVRYRDGLDIRIDFSDAAKEKSIVMVTLQMLIDNAIKHNIVQTSSPLRILICDKNGDTLHVQNNKQPRKQIETSNGQGLAHLQELYSYITDRQVVIKNAADHFEINLPLL